MMTWIGLAPWKVEFPFEGSLTSTFRLEVHVFLPLPSDEATHLEILMKLQVKIRP